MKSQKIILEAFWGNDDASSSIIIPLSKWNKIRTGGFYKKLGWGWYEGEKYKVLWEFNEKIFTIYDLKDECLRIDKLEIENINTIIAN